MTFNGISQYLAMLYINDNIQLPGPCFFCPNNKAYNKRTQKCKIHDQYDYSDNELFGSWCNSSVAASPAASPAKTIAAINTMDWSPSFGATLAYRYSMGGYGSPAAARKEISSGSGTNLQEGIEGRGSGAGAVDPGDLRVGVMAKTSADLEQGNKSGSPGTPSYALSHQALMPIFLPPPTPLVIAHIDQVPRMPNTISDDSTFTSDIPASQHAMSNYALAIPPAL